MDLSSFITDETALYDSEQPSKVLLVEFSRRNEDSKVDENKKQESNNSFKMMKRLPAIDFGSKRNSICNRARLCPIREELPKADYPQKYTENDNKTWLDATILLIFFIVFGIFLIEVGYSIG